MCADDTTLGAFLERELGPDEAERFESHLLVCDDCWTAVRLARRGRELAESLREVAPPEVRDRIRMAVGLLPQPSRHPTRRRRRRVAATMSILVLGAALIAGRLAPHRASDPAAVAAVVRLADRVEPTGWTTRLTADHQQLRVYRLDVGGTPVVLARSDRVFPMPTGGHMVAGHSAGPWVASRGRLTLLCYGAPSPALLVGAVGAQQLAAAARAFGIAGNVQSNPGDVRQ